MSFIYGVLLTHSNLRLHDDLYELIEHNESENVAVQYRQTDKAEELAEEMSNIELESNGPVPGSPPVLGHPSGISSVTWNTSKRRKRHVMSMIGVEPTGPNPSSPNSKATSTSPPRTGTYTSSTLIYITSCFGASCLGMPWCFAQCGWALALILLILTALVTQWGASLLLQCAVKVSGEPSGGVSIKQVAIIASPTLASLPEVVVIINCLGSAISALVVSGFLLPRTFRSLDSLREKFHRDLMASIEWKNLLKERVLWISIITACVLPLCFLRDITPLKYTGLVSLVAVTFATVVMASAYFSPSFFDTCEVMGRSPCATDVVAFRLDNVTGVLASIPAFFFNYSCNYQLLTVHNALAIKSTKTSNLAIGNTMIIITTIYIVLGLTTYRTFGADLESNFLGNYGNNVVIDLVRLFIILSVALLFPLTIFTARASVMSILGPAYVTKFNSKHVFFTISLLLVAFAYVVAISVANLNVILGVGGALSTVPITLVLPGSYTASLAEKGPAGDGDRRKGRVAMITGYVLTFLCLYGALAMRN
ncbi:hypothetical protein VYU27_008634 [Nannochloropsis oceanica]